MLGDLPMKSGVDCAGTVYTGIIIIYILKLAQGHILEL